MNTITVKNRVLAGDKPVKTIVLGNKQTKTITLWPFQNDILLNHLSIHKRTLTESPTGSGKSSLMLSYAAIVAKKGKKTVIITPMLGINHNFRKYVAHSKFCAKGQEDCEYTIPHGGIIEEPKQQKTEALKRFLSGPNESIYVTTYQAFKLALDSGVDTSDLVLLVDEVHHSDTGNDDSYLGSILRQCDEKCSEIHCFTATDFRTDGGRPVPESFRKYRRTLEQHYSEGFCPDFGVFARFYYGANKAEFEKLASGKNIGNPKALLEAYVDEYEQNPLPTMMYVDNARQANILQKMLLTKSPKLRILNLGSDDGVALVSDNGKLCRMKFTHLSDMPLDIDAVISIRLCNEGVDWAECAQTFSPRITSSLQLFIQRCIGRTLRRKRKNHVSPLYSRVVIFEISLNDRDRDEVTKAFLPMAIVLKAICEGLDFTDSFMLKLPGKHQHRFESERVRLRTQSNVAMNSEILQKLLYRSVAGASAAELITLCHELYASDGIELSGPMVTNLLIQTKVIDKTDILDLEEAIRKRDKNLEIRSFSDFVSEYAEEIAKLRVIGVSDFIGILSGRNDLDIIAKLLADYVASSSAKNKARLLELARSGAKRPSGSARDLEEKRLGSALTYYTSESSRCYDVDFHVAIREIRPDWFEDTVSRNKEQILELARSGAKKPLTSSHNPDEKRLGSALMCYTVKSSHCYDEDFRAVVRKIRPDWFEDTTVRKKEQILAIARSGKRRPSSSSKDRAERALGTALGNYIHDNKGNHGSYDNAFDVTIHNLRPDWFEDTVARKKEQILEIARNGERRPSNKAGELGEALSRYLKHGDICYDPAFDQFIHELRPDWFADTVLENKKKLLELAATGGARPSGKSDQRRLGSALVRYTNHGKAYDKQFDKLIRNSRPDWFKFTAAEKKTRLLELARSGGDRPSCSAGNKDERLLGLTLSRSTRKRSSEFDSQFDIEIRSFRPDWFEDTAAKTKEQLVAIAKQGRKRPLKGKIGEETRLAQAICQYTNPGKCFDPVFNKLIRELRPDWFNKLASARKDELLSRAKNGQPKPNSKEERLRASLGKYVTEGSGSYDPDFTRQIKALRPDWFIKGAIKGVSKAHRYAGPNKYRDFLVEVLKYYQLTEFTDDCEFWTLGGSEWYEYRYLLKSGISFGLGSYHNVDRENLNKLRSISVCSHPETEFADIHRLWRNPAVVAYDSTVALVPANTGLWQELCHLSIAAAKKSGEVLVVWNFMVGYANKMYGTVETDLYDNWIQMMEDLAEHNGISVDFFKEGQITKRKKSSTPMLAGCCKLTLTQAAQKIA